MDGQNNQSNEPITKTFSFKVVVDIPTDPPLPAPTSFHFCPEAEHLQLVTPVLDYCAYAYMEYYKCPPDDPNFIVCYLIEQTSNNIQTKTVGRFSQ